MATHMIDGSRLSWRGLLVEGLGTGVLTAAVVGAGLLGQRLSPADVMAQLLCAALAAAVTLALLMTLLAPISGGHLNPVLTLVEAIRGRISRATALGWVTAQTIGACGGTVVVHVMFEEELIRTLGPIRTGTGVWIGEIIATAGLVVVFVLARTRRSMPVPVGVAGWSFVAYFLTSSMAFANPAMTIGRALTDTFAGISRSSVPGYLIAQVLGAAIGLVLGLVLSPRTDTAPTNPEQPTEKTAGPPTTDRRDPLRPEAQSLERQTPADRLTRSLIINRPHTPQQ